MRDITVDYSRVLTHISKEEIEKLEREASAAQMTVEKGSGQGNDFLGWVKLPSDYDKKEFERIKKASEKIKSDSDVLVVIGIGGSYLGARAAIEALNHSFYNMLPKAKRKTPEIYFAGNNISSVYFSDLMDVLEGKDISVNVISKSGTTTEPAIAFRFFKEFMEKKYGREEARKRIFATTDKAKGALKSLADAEGYESFVIPDNVGGRFSVLTAVGLLPIAVSGIDIDQMMKGAQDASIEYSSDNKQENAAITYAAVRNGLYKNGKLSEVLVNFEPYMHFFSEWWKQLYGESEGKDKKGIFPASVDFTTDLHSMGQFIQDGTRMLFETFINVEAVRKEETIISSDENIDGLNFMAGKTMDYVNKKALYGTVLAHNDGGVPTIIINVPEMNAYYFGKLGYRFEKACGIRGDMLGVNPFNQPGVEAYKKNMFALLGKPGYEDMKEKLESRLG